MKRYLLFLITGIIFSNLGAVASPADTISKKTAPKKSFVETMQQRGRDEIVRSNEVYRWGRIMIKQQQATKELEKTAQDAKIYLKNAIDTVSVLHELEGVKASFAIVKDGIITNKGTAQTQRNLSVSTVVLRQLQDQMNRRKIQVDAFAGTIVKYRDKIDSLYTDTTMYTFSSDSVKVRAYIKKLTLIVKEIGPVDSALHKGILTSQNLQSRVDSLVFELNTAAEEIDIFQKNLEDQITRREFANIWNPVGFSRPFEQIIDFSATKERMALVFYIKNNIGKLLLVLIAIITSIFFLTSLKRHIADDGNLLPDFNGQLVIRYPVLSAIIVVISPLQFIFVDPPFIFSFCLLVICVISLTIIFKNFITGYWWRFWLVISALFLIAGFDDLLLQASRTERWIMVGLSVAGSLYAIYILAGKRSNELRERYIIYSIWLLLAFEVMATLFNLYGRFNLAKTCLIGGYMSVVVAIIFLWVVRLINEGLGLAATVYKRPDKKLLYINFDRVGDRAPLFFYLLLIIGWFVLVGRNFYGFKHIAQPITNFIMDERTIGDYTFTVKGLVVFAGITICAMILSRLTSFFASDPSANTGVNKNNKVAAGSYILLVRIFIISVGFFLAIAAAGIPLDKITIVLGALSVGVGLGLQGLVSNLVSGLVIAFEKPVSVGDLIEVNDKSGTMKSIGFRSSVVSLADGAYLIIPNSDLLSQHLVNWTMGKNHKKITITLGVAYGTDINQAKAVLTSILTADDRIMASPAAVVVAKDFDESAINFQLIFWIHHISESLSIRSDIIAQIDKTFKEQGIVIPFPQQEVTVKQVQGGSGGEVDKNASPAK